MQKEFDLLPAPNGKKAKSACTSLGYIVPLFGV
jgi:hypothetical protein